MLNLLESSSGCVNSNVQSENGVNTFSNSDSKSARVSKVFCKISEECQLREPKAEELKILVDTTKVASTERRSFSCSEKDYYCMQKYEVPVSI